jgi:lysyl-tRNA synthetase class 2
VSTDYRQFRIDKLAKLRESSIVPASHFEASHCLAEIGSLDDETPARVSGRLVAIRSFGKLVFAHLQDRTGRAQVSFEKNVLDPELFARVGKLLDVGDFVGVEGEVWTTRKGERTVRARDVVVLAKGLRPLPEKWHGLQDREARARRRYLDLLANPETHQRFVLRSKVVSFIRRYLDGQGFLEVETPILQAASSGAAARPFETHHHALDRDLFLRISPETYLKRLVVGGLERVYEIGKNFRNEGIDPSHLQEFTMLEWYVAYWSYRDNMRFVQAMTQAILQEFTGGLTLEREGVTLDFSGDWPEVDYVGAVREATGIDILELRDHDSLTRVVKERLPGVEAEKYPSYPGLVDALYKRTVRPNLIQPCFLVRHPAELVPLARRSDDDPRLLDMFQVVANRWEMVKAYSELVDPLEQRERMLEQQTYRDQGDDETMMMEEDYLECMEYGMPPISGLGLGIDRLMAFLTGAESLRDVVLFPSLRDDEGVVDPGDDDAASQDPAPQDPASQDSADRATR